MTINQVDLGQIAIELFGGGGIIFMVVFSILMIHAMKSKQTKYLKDTKGVITESIMTAIMFVMLFIVLHIVFRLCF